MVIQMEPCSGWEKRCISSMVNEVPLVRGPLMHDAGESGVGTFLGDTGGERHDRHEYKIKGWLTVSYSFSRSRGSWLACTRIDVAPPNTAAISRPILESMIRREQRGPL